MQCGFDRNEAIGMLLTPENLMPPQVGATCAFQKHHGEGRRKGTQGHVRDRIGRGLEGRGEGLLSTHLQGAELPLLKSGKVLARKAPGAFLSTEYFCRSWGHQCARLLRCSARCRSLLSYRCFEAPPRQKTVRVLLTGCGQFVVAGWVIGRSLQRFPHAFLERARRMASSSSGGMGR